MKQSVSGLSHFAPIGSAAMTRPHRLCHNRGTFGILLLGAALVLVPARAAAQSSPMVQFAAVPDAVRAREVQCLAQAIIYEAGLEPLEGRQAVAQVIMNRLRAPAYPKTVCGVVYQGSTRRTGCQFTFTCDGSLSRPVSEGRFADAVMLAQDAIDGRLPDRVGEATHYHAHYVNPYWAPSLNRVGRIGAHIFYNSAAKGRSTIASGRAARGEEAPAAPAEPFLPWGLPLSSFAAMTPADR